MSIIFSDSLVASVVDPLVTLNSPIFGYQSFVTAAGVTSGNAATGYPVTNVANVSTASFWRANDTTEQYVTAIINPAQTIDYVGVARHNFSTAGVAVSVETQEGLGDPWVEVISASIPANNNALIFRFEEQTAYGVRLKLAAGSVAPEISVFFAGKLLVSTQRIYVGHSPITLNRRVEVVSGMSESGNYLGRIITGSNLTTSVSLTHLEPDWYRSNFDPFVVAAQNTPFFFSWRPIQYPDETAFAWLTNDPQPSNMMPNGMMQVSLEMSGVNA
jgi:hypothetical protein